MPTNQIHFTVYGNPIPKARPRVVVSRFNRRARAYTPVRTKQWEAEVAQAATLAMGNEEPHSGPVELTVWFYRGDKRRVDGDNCEKAIADSLNGIVWLDDQQVIDCHWYKRYDRHKPRAEVSVRLIDEVRFEMP